MSLCKSCQASLNDYWLYCPWCGKQTGTKKSIDAKDADLRIERMKERHREAL